MLDFQCPLGKTKLPTNSTKSCRVRPLLSLLPPLISAPPLPHLLSLPECFSPQPTSPWTPTCSTEVSSNVTSPGSCLLSPPCPLPALPLPAASLPALLAPGPFNDMCDYLANARPLKSLSCLGEGGGILWEEDVGEQSSSSSSNALTAGRVIRTW